MMDQDQIKQLQETHQQTVAKYVATGEIPVGFEGDPALLELAAKKSSAESMEGTTHD